MIIDFCKTIQACLLKFRNIIFFLHFCFLMIKDYYEILQIQPSATATEIKAAYRKLAHLYHPDKTQGDKYALASFNMIKEAYETLSKPSLREDYLQRRWLYKAQAKSFSNATQTPDSILQLSIAANRRVQAMDIFRADKEGIAESIAALLSYDNIVVLNEFNDTIINHQVIMQILEISAVLNPPVQENILNVLQKINMAPNTRELIAIAEKRCRQSIFFNKLRPWLIVLAVMLCVLLIWITGRGVD